MSVSALEQGAALGPSGGTAKGCLRGTRKGHWELHLDALIPSAERPNQYASAALQAMGAIAGIQLNSRQHVLTSVLQSVAAKLKHRAPDGWDFWQQKELGFAQGFHCTTHWNQNQRSMARDCASGVVLSADATVYNRAELLPQLRGFLASQGEPSDVEVILASWMKWGAACSQHLSGDFSFSLWEPNSELLYCARDHFGARPFYYSFSPAHGFAFASEIKGLLCVPWVDRTIDDLWIADYLMGIESDRERTVYAGIRRLPPASRLSLSNGVLSIESYWSPDPTSELRLEGDREYEDMFRDKFDQSVRARLDGCPGVGILLSGGLDSSAVAVTAAKAQGAHASPRLESFSFLYHDSPDGDERTWSRAVTRKANLESNTIDADPHALFSRCNDLLAILDQPYNNPMYPLGLAIWERIGSSDLIVTIDGVDGDSVISYNNRFLAELASSFQWWSLFKESVGLSHWMFDDQISALSIMWTRGIRPSLMKKEVSIRTKLGFQKMRSRFCPDILDRGLLLRTGMLDRLDAIAEEERSLLSHRAFQCFEVSHGVMSSSLESINLMAAQNGIEARHPFFDRDLVEFCISLPRDQKIRNGWTRSIVRRSLSNDLPHQILWRGGKWGPEEWITTMIREHHAEWLQQFIKGSLSELEGFVDINSARTSLERFSANGNYEDAFLCSSLAILVFWLRRSALA